MKTKQMEKDGTTEGRRGRGKAQCVRGNDVRGYNQKFPDWVDNTKWEAT